MDFLIKPNLDESDAQALGKLAKAFERQMEKTGVLPQPALMEEIGRRLWKASGLKDNDLAVALEQAQDEKSPARLIITGHENQHLPWELILSNQEDIGYAARHPWCTLVRRIRGAGKKPPISPAGRLKFFSLFPLRTTWTPKKVAWITKKRKRSFLPLWTRPCPRASSTSTWPRTAV